MRPHDRARAPSFAQGAAQGATLGSDHLILGGFLVLCICNSALGMFHTRPSFVAPPVWPGDEGTSGGGSELVDTLRTLGHPLDEPPQPPEERPYVHFSACVLYLASFLCAYSTFSVLLPFVPAADPSATVPGMLEEGAKGRRLFGIAAVMYLSAVRTPLPARACSSCGAATAETSAAQPEGRVHHDRTKCTVQ